MNRNWIILGLIIGVLVLSGCTSTSTGNVEPQPVGTKTQTVPANPVKANPNVNVEAGAVGTVYKIKYLNTEYEVTLKEAKFASSDNSYVDKSYALAFFEIKNIGEKTDFFSPTVYAETADREKIDRTIAFGLGDDYSKTLTYVGTLNPGQKTSGWVAFEVSSDATTLNVFFEYSNPFINQQPQYIKYQLDK